MKYYRYILVLVINIIKKEKRLTNEHYFLNIDGVSNKKSKVSAGKISAGVEITFVEFNMNIDDIDPAEFDTFRNEVENCVQAPYHLVMTSTLNLITKNPWFVLI